MAIVGSSTGRAPASRRSATSELACSRVRVTSTRRPSSGRVSNQRSRSRRRTTSPTPATAGERLGLLATAAEYERVAALQANDHPPGARPLDQHRIDLVLAQRMSAGRLAHVDALGMGRRKRDELRSYQAIVDEHFGARE